MMSEYDVILKIEGVLEVSGRESFVTAFLQQHLDKLIINPMDKLIINPKPLSEKHSKLDDIPDEEVRCDQEDKKSEFAQVSKRKKAPRQVRRLAKPKTEEQDLKIDFDAIPSDREAIDAFFNRKTSPKDTKTVQMTVIVYYLTKILGHEGANQFGPGAGQA